MSSCDRRQIPVEACDVVSLDMSHRIDITVTNAQHGKLQTECVVKKSMKLFL